jgi:hypothetical protein
MLLFLGGYIDCDPPGWEIFAAMRYAAACFAAESVGSGGVTFFSGT